MFKFVLLNSATRHNILAPTKCGSARMGHQRKCELTSRQLFVLLRGMHDQLNYLNDWHPFLYRIVQIAFGKTELRGAYTSHELRLLYVLDLEISIRCGVSFGGSTMRHRVRGRTGSNTETP